MSVQVRERCLLYLLKKSPLTLTLSYAPVPPLISLLNFLLQKDNITKLDIIHIKK